MIGGIESGKSTIIKQMKVKSKMKIMGKTSYQAQELQITTLANPGIQKVHALK